MSKSPPGSLSPAVELYSVIAEARQWRERVLRSAYDDRVRQAADDAAAAEAISRRMEAALVAIRNDPLRANRPNTDELVSAVDEAIYRLLWAKPLRPSSSAYWDGDPADDDAPDDRERRAREVWQADWAESIADALDDCEFAARAAVERLVIDLRFHRPPSDNGPPASEPATVVVAEPIAPTTPNNESSMALLRVFTNGLTDDRIGKAMLLLGNDELTVNEKLTKIDALVPFPATASAQQLGDMLQVTKTAIQKTDWWIQNRKGEKANEIGRRRAGHKTRAESYKVPAADRDDE